MADFVLRCVFSCTIDRHQLRCKFFRHHLGRGMAKNICKVQGGRTLLLTAAEEGNTECVRLLLEAGVNIEAKEFKVRAFI